MKRSTTVPVVIVLVLSLILMGCSTENSSNSSANATTLESDPSTAIEETTLSQGETEPSVSDGSQSIEVDKNLFNVKVTLPASMFENENGSAIDKESIKAEAKGEGVHDVIFNDDGSVTYVMDKHTHAKMLSEMEQSIEQSIEELLSGEEKVESFVDIKHNQDFSEFSVYVDKSKFSEWDTFGSTMMFYMYGGFYHLFSGDSDKTVIIKYIDNATDEIIKTADSSKVGEEG